MPRTPIRIQSALTLETRRGAFSGKRWMELLAAIGELPSITAAAKRVGLSYKAAWDAVEAMNNLADTPLVVRTVGGRGGGGASLTARGQQLLATFREVEGEHARFVERLNASIATAPQDLKMIGRLSMITSARNQFGGKVTRIVPGAINDEVVLQLSGGEKIVATVTRMSTQQLALRVGGDAVALVKASSVIVGVRGGAAMKLSARNQLPGTIARIVPGAVNTEVVVALAGGNSMAAIVTNTSAREMKLAEGMPAVAIFKASSVILAVSA